MNSKINIRLIIAADGDPITFLTNLKTVLLPGNAQKVDRLIQQLNSKAMMPAAAINAAATLLEQDEQQRETMPAGEDIMGRENVDLMSQQAPEQTNKNMLEDEDNSIIPLTQE